MRHDVGVLVIADDLQDEWKRVRTRLNVAQGTVRPQVEVGAQDASKQCHVAETALRSARRALRKLKGATFERKQLEAQVGRHLARARKATQRLEGVGDQGVLALWGQP